MSYIYIYIRNKIYIYISSLFHLAFASEISTNSAVKTPLFRRLDQELRGRREAMLEERGWKVTSDERQRS